MSRIPNVVGGPDWFDLVVLVLTAPIWIAMAGFALLLAALPWLCVYWAITDVDE